MQGVFLDLGRPQTEVVRKALTRVDRELPPIVLVIRGSVRHQHQSAEGHEFPSLFFAFLKLFVLGSCKAVKQVLMKYRTSHPNQNPWEGVGSM